MSGYDFRRTALISLPRLTIFGSWTLLMVLMTHYTVTHAPRAAVVMQAYQMVSKMDAFVQHCNGVNERVQTTPRLESNNSLSISGYDQAISEHPALPHIKYFNFDINNESRCATSKEKGIYFLILVSSAPTNFVARQTIRNTWGSVSSLDNWAIRLVFTLGSEELNPELQKTIYQESLEHGDIASSSSFQDTYRNLTLKHLMGYQWVLNYCPGAKIVVRTDDDVFIDVFQLFTFISSHHGFNPVDLFLCGQKYGVRPERDTGGKWRATRDEYALDVYPTHCSALGYLITVDVLERLLCASMRIPLFWIDDVYVTGILREATGKELAPMNLGLTWITSSYEGWLYNQTAAKSPFTFINVQRGGNFTVVMNQMWNKTKVAWSR